MGYRIYPENVGYCTSERLRPNKVWQTRRTTWLLGLWQNYKNLSLTRTPISHRNSEANPKLNIPIAPPLHSLNALLKSSWNTPIHIQIRVHVNFLKFMSMYCRAWSRRLEKAMHWFFFSMWNATDSRWFSYLRSMSVSGYQKRRRVLLSGCFKHRFSDWFFFGFFGLAERLSSEVEFHPNDSRKMREAETPPI